jgi:hypothetical protein
MAKNTIETGNPVYPLAWSLFGGTDWDADLNAKFAAGHAASTHLFTDPPALLGELATNVIDVTTKSDWQSSLVFAFLPFAWLVGDRRRTTWVAVYALTFFLLWFATTHRIDRFWVPMLPALCVLAGLGAEGVRQRWLTEVRAEWFPVLPTLGVAALTAGVVLLTVLYNFAFMTSGVCGPDQFLSRYHVLQQQAFRFTPLIEFLEHTTETRNGKVLLVGEAQVFDLRGDYVYNTVFDYSIFEQWTADPADTSSAAQRRSLPPHQIRQKLREEGITHIAINWLELLRYRTTYRYTDYVSPERFQALVDSGVLEVLPVGSGVNQDIDTLQESWQTEVQTWGASLIRRNFGRNTLPALTVYRVVE